MFPPVEDVTSDGYDLQFGTNVLGRSFFTLLEFTFAKAAFQGISTSHNYLCRSFSLLHRQVLQGKYGS